MDVASVNAGKPVRGLTALLAVAYGATAFAGSPQGALSAALADARTLTPDRARHARYLWHPQPTPTTGAVLAFWCNSLSREPDLVAPRQVRPDLWAIDCRDYGWTLTTYGALGQTDPYFHHQGVTAGGLVAAGEWLDARSIAELVILTQSQSPLLRADWFVVATAQQADRTAGYYDMLGLGKKEADFHALIGADAKAAKRLKLETAAVVAKSGVTLNNRSMTRLQALTGGYWFTQDFKTSTQKQNTVRLLDGDTEPPGGDASEQYGTLPNGLFAFWLQDAKGVRQDTAPDFIASDGQSPSTDRRVHVGISCARCHAGGLQSIDDWSRKVLREPLGLASPDYEKVKRLRQLYLSDLDGQIAEDNARYAKALKRLNGLTPQQNAQAFADFHRRYAEDEVDAATFAAELGVTERQFLDALRAYAAGVKVIDPALAGYLADPPAPARRAHVEEAFPVAAGIMMTSGGKR